MGRIFDVLRSLAFYLAFYLGTVFFVLVSQLGLLVSRKLFVFAVHGWSRYHRLCVNWLLGIRVVVEGTLPGRDTLVAIKHESFFEAIDLPNLLESPAIIAKAELVRIPLWGKTGQAYGLIPVERDQGAKALRRMMTAARGYVAQGRPLAIFPEGTRVPHGEQWPLQSGFAGLYKMLGLPVVPIAVDSGACYHRKWKRRGTIVYKVCETIPAGLPRDQIEGLVLDAINTLNIKPD